MLYSLIFTDTERNSHAKHLVLGTWEIFQSLQLRITSISGLKYLGSKDVTNALVLVLSSQVYWISKKYVESQIWLEHSNWFTNWVHQSNIFLLSYRVKVGSISFSSIRNYSLFIVVMCIIFQHINTSLDSLL